MLTPERSTTLVDIKPSPKREASASTIHHHKDTHKIPKFISNLSIHHKIRNKKSLTGGMICNHKKKKTDKNRTEK